MSKNLKINNITYTGVDTIQIPLSDGSGNATFVEKSSGSTSGGYTVSTQTIQCSSSNDGFKFPCAKSGKSIYLFQPDQEPSASNRLPFTITVTLDFDKDMYYAIANNYSNKNGYSAVTLNKETDFNAEAGEWLYHKSAGTWFDAGNTLTMIAVKEG